MKYLNQVVFHLLTYSKEGWQLHSTWHCLDDAKRKALEFKNKCDCRIDEISYRNVYIQKRK